MEIWNWVLTVGMGVLGYYVNKTDSKISALEKENNANVTKIAVMESNISGIDKDIDDLKDSIDKLTLSNEKLAEKITEVLISLGTNKGTN